MPAPRRLRLSRLTLGVTLVSMGLALAATAAPRLTTDPDFEIATPIAQSVRQTPAEQHGPPGLVSSPLAVPDQSSGPRTRFKMRDGEVLIAQVLAFDGQMYALRSPHSTLLVRKDLFVAITPLVLSSKGVLHPIVSRSARTSH